MATTNLAGRLAKLEQVRVMREGPQLTLMLNFPTEEARAEAERKHRQYPETSIRYVFRSPETKA